MMKLPKRTAITLLSLTTACALSHGARAGTISSLGAVSGPGSVSGFSVTTSTPNIDEQFLVNLTGGNVSFNQNVTGTGVPFEIQFNVLPSNTAPNPVPGGGAANTNFVTEYAFSIPASTNLSGAGFGRVNFALGTGSGGGFVQGGIPGLSFDADAAPGFRAAATGAPAFGPALGSPNYGATLITFQGNQPNGSPTTFNFDIDVPDNVAHTGFTFTLQQVASVPEPSTYAMFALGLLSMIWYGRRRKAAQSVAVSSLV